MGKVAPTPAGREVTLGGYKLLWSDGRALYLEPYVRVPLEPGRWYDRTELGHVLAFGACPTLASLFRQHHRVPYGHKVVLAALEGDALSQGDRFIGKRLKVLEVLDVDSPLRAFVLRWARDALFKADISEHALHDALLRADAAGEAVPETPELVGALEPYEDAGRLKGYAVETFKATFLSDPVTSAHEVWRSYSYVLNELYDLKRVGLLEHRKKFDDDLERVVRGER